MKIIFSRKGFDWDAGRVPSPIFHDQRFCSLPIPYRWSKYRFEDVAFGRENLGTIVRDLTRGRLTGRHRTHVDPDLRRDALPRHRGWLPAFGPGGRAQTHLANSGVGVDDIFLFFGWFREVEKETGRYQYVGKAPNIHVLFGWLQIGRVYREFPRDSKLPVGLTLTRKCRIAKSGGMRNGIMTTRRCTWRIVNLTSRVCERTCPAVGYSKNMTTGSA